MQREKLKRDDLNGSENLSIHSNYSNETSYNLKLVSFEDSQVDGFVPFSSPSILFWHANRKAVGEQTMLNLQPANMSEIEIARGDVDEESSRLVQLPAENTMELMNASETTQKEKLALNKSNLTLIQNQESKLFPQKFEEEMESITDISKLKEKSEVSENEKSRISSISNSIKLPKKLDFLAESDSISIADESSSNEPLEMAEIKPDLKLELLDNVSIDLSDEQTQIEEDDEEVHLSKSDEFVKQPSNRIEEIESEIDKQLYKLIDQRLEMIIKKKLEQNFPSKSKKNPEKVETKPLAWDISLSSSIGQNNEVSMQEERLAMDSKNPTKSTKDAVQSLRDSMPNKFDDTRDLTNISNDSFENTIPLRNVSNQGKMLSEKNLKEILENCSSIEHLLKELNIKDARKVDKENYSSEASTQTSFVAENASSANRVFTNLQNQHEHLEKQQRELEKQLRKEKLKQVIYFQKAQHENRLKQLEKLAERERLYAEKLRNMLNTPNDSSLLDKTEWQEANANLTLIEQGLNQTDHLFNFLQEENSRRKSDFIRRNVDKQRLKNVNNDISFDSTRSNVSVASTIRSSSSALNVEKKSFISNQVDNLHKLQSPTSHQLSSSSTSSTASSKKVLILKENESSKYGNKQQQTNDFDADEDGRIFFTLSSTQTQVDQTKRRSPAIASGSNPKGSMSNLKHLSLNESSKSPRLTEFNYMAKSCNSEPTFKQSVEWAKRQPGSAVNALEKMSLQDAFKHFKRDLIARSEKRLQVIEERSQVRHEQAEYKRKQQELLDKELVERKRALRRPNSSNALCNYFEVKAQERKRQMSAHEIKEMSKKNYEKLPEVKQKQMRQRLEQERLLNRIKYSIYKKTIQQHVLLRGPNFDMYYKALDD